MGTLLYVATGEGVVTVKANGPRGDSIFDVLVTNPDDGTDVSPQRFTVTR